MNGSMSRECRACGATDLTARYRVGEFRILKCAACDSLTTDSAMTPDAAEAWYGAEYFRGGDYADYESSQDLLKRNFRRFVRRMRQHHSGRRLLEVGCSYGYFLDVARDYWDVEGIDISEAARSASARLGSRVVTGDLLSETGRAGGYDWIVAWDTIEHLDQPRSYARRCLDLLAPGGFLAVTTGDVSSAVARLTGRRWRLLTPPSHLTFFSRKGMTRLLSDAGFEQIQMGTTGYYRSLDFTVYRLLGPQMYRAFTSTGRPFQAWLKRAGFYVNLFDIIFVTARKPDRPPGR